MKYRIIPSRRTVCSQNQNLPTVMSIALSLKNAPPQQLQLSIIIDSISHEVGREQKAYFCYMK